MERNCNCSSKILNKYTNHTKNDLNVVFNKYCDVSNHVCICPTIQIILGTAFVERKTKQNIFNKGIFCKSSSHQCICDLNPMRCLLIKNHDCICHINSK